MSFRIPNRLIPRRHSRGVSNGHTLSGCCSRLLLPTHPEEALLRHLEGSCPPRIPAAAKVLTMNDFKDSYLGQLREVVGRRLILMPGARCLIEREDGHILMQQRADNGLWCMPSGYAEAGEDIFQVMLREVREETGLEVLDAKPWGYSSDPRHETMHYPNGDVVQAFGLDFHATQWRGELYADGVETLALDWFPPDALPSVLEGHGRAVARFQDFRRTGIFQLY